MHHHLTRRQFLKAASLAAAATHLLPCPASPRPLSPNDKLNLGVIGTANRARQNIAALESENIVALCDIDDTMLAAASQRFPEAKTYNDFRKLLDQPNIDAVVVSTADHTHAVATAAALRLGKHVYCEKPLTHTVHEARTIANLAAKNPRLATQMGTQIHASDNYRRAVELVQSGAIGPVRDCHVWCEKSLPGGDQPADTPPIPPNLHWDLWLGPAPARPYHPEYLPKTWRRWWDFGEGILGDMGCHYLDLAFWALNLRHPLTIEAEGPPPHPQTVPPWLMVRYEFPTRGQLPPVHLRWYDGGKLPDPVATRQVPAWPNGVLFVGDEGMLLADYSRHKLLPADRFAGLQPPTPFIPESPGHHLEWIQACKTGRPTTCNFAYASVLTETVLLGIVAYRADQKLQWDAARLETSNCPQAARFIRTRYRKDWQL